MKEQYAQKYFFSMVSGGKELHLLSRPHTLPGHSGGRVSRWYIAALLMSIVLAGCAGSGNQTTSGTGTATVQTRPNFQRGIVYPRWQSDAYGPEDTTWLSGIRTIRSQTAATWLEIPALFKQSTNQSTDVGPSDSTPSLATFTAGIQAAHNLGYKVFFVPLMSVPVAGGWSGSIDVPKAKQPAWFESYWKNLKPYAQAAADNGVEQMAIGTELQTMQKKAPAAFWNQLIANVHSVFTKNLTYDMNWSSLTDSTPDWFTNPLLTLIGVSSYIPLLDTNTHVDPATVPTLWKQKIGDKLDALSLEISKPVLISEIGYRDSADAFYHTWEATSKLAPDTSIQATAFNATLSNTMNDTHIAGTFFWGWDDVDRFAIKGQSSVQTLHKWYDVSS